MKSKKEQMGPKSLVYNNKNIIPKDHCPERQFLRTVIAPKVRSSENEIKVFVPKGRSSEFSEERPLGTKTYRRNGRSE